METRVAVIGIIVEDDELYVGGLDLRRQKAVQFCFVNRRICAQYGCADALLVHNLFSPSLFGQVLPRSFPSQNKDSV